ncbi:MAG: thiamine pyrophosphate-dependent enzyme, partial [Gemmatimonadota bacterium]
MDAASDSADAPASELADGYNVGYADQLRERQLRERGVVPPPLAVPPGLGPPAPTLLADPRLLRAAAIAGKLVAAYREQGHLAVPLDPLGTPPPGHPTLELDFYGITEEELARVPAPALGLERLGWTALDVLESLWARYCGRIGYEIDHVEDPAQLEWLIDRIESGRHWPKLSVEGRRLLLQRLTEVEGLERFLHRSYLGAKRFSIEGLDMLVPMVDELLERTASRGTREVFLGMAHRGRLNVIAHIVGRSYAAIIGEFEGQHSIGIQTTVPEGGSGDVKYHYGAYGTYTTDAATLNVLLAPNPSHLEYIDPVVEGMARGSRELRFGSRLDTRTRETFASDRLLVLPILIHGDAAFMGQGVVAETLNLSRLEGYETGGTVHVIANNQLGFTTLPRDARSARYASDLALGFRIPVVHVNADDPEACLAAIRLASDYRIEFGEDIVVDLVGYRRYGHNEGDEPGYTQPEMYRKIAEHPSVRTLWKDRLVAEGAITEGEADAMADRVAEALQAARRQVISEGAPEATESSVDGDSAAPNDSERAGEAFTRPPGHASAGEEDPCRRWRPVSLWAELTEDNRSET